MSTKKNNGIGLCGASLILLVAAGCTAGHTLSGPELERFPTVLHVGDTVHVTTVANVTEDFEVTGIEQGTLRGATTDGESVALPVSDISAIEYRSRAPWKTAGLVVGSAFGVGVLIARDSCKPDEWGTPGCLE